MEAIKRSSTSSSASGSVRTDIDIGTGTWEITSCTASIGGSEVIVAVIPVIMSGWIAVEQKDEQTTSTHDLARSDVIAQGIATEHYHIVMERPTIVRGPCKVKTHMTHKETFEHTLAVTFRRLHP